MKILGFVLIFALIGLAGGYAYFGQVRGAYVNPLELILPAKGINLFQAFGEVSGIYEQIRTRVLLCGLAGAAIGLCFAYIGGKRRK